MRWFVAVAHGAAALVVVPLANCAPPPPPPPPTAVALSITASADINPGRSGHGAPLMLRVYQLGAASGFAGADFFLLFNSDAKTLGPDLVHRDDIMLVPGGHKDIALAPQDNVHAVAVFAGLRNPQGGSWRVVVPVKPHATAAATIAVSSHGLTLATPPASSPKFP